MADTELSTFQDMVFQDTGLRDSLVNILDETGFIAAVVAAARQRGLIFQEQDVRTAMQANRRKWIERWIT